MLDARGVFGGRLHPRCSSALQGIPGFSLRLPDQASGLLDEKQQRAVFVGVRRRHHPGLREAGLMRLGLHHEGPVRLLHVPPTKLSRESNGSQRGETMVGRRAGSARGVNAFSFAAISTHQQP